MRMLHVYAGNLFGGVERMLLSQAQLQEIAGWQQEFALCFEGRLSDGLRRAGATLTKLPQVRVSRPLSVLQGRAALSRLLLKRRFDAVICHGIWAYCIFARAIISAGRPP